ncbi:MAG: alpha/beta hydrolase [Acidobacteria bacterium]|nr:alpha/beta hydrolase [Acidobacteriota bacterium]
MTPLLLLLLSSVPFEHGYANNDGVKIHYASYGKADGPLVVMVHGFPDFWYTWRDQMQVLGDAGYRCVAMDLRGYNLSDKPAGLDNYDMKLLVGDVLSVIRANGRSKAIVMAHDWGGAIAWQVALNVPQMVEKLVILNLPHPRGLSRELATNPEQQKASEYARRFQEPGSHAKLTAAALAGWVKDPEAKKAYVEAFERSSLESMMAYYQKNYPRPPYQQSNDVRRLAMPVLLIHGLKDTALLAPALDGTWDWVDDLTMVTIPEASHFVQQDATEKVSKSVKSWLGRDK